MTPADLEALEALCARLPPGPWFWNNVGWDMCGEAPHGEPGWGSYCVFVPSDSDDRVDTFATFNFIAQMRNAAPDLIRLARKALTGCIWKRGGSVFGSTVEFWMCPFCMQCFNGDEPPERECGGRVDPARSGPCTD